MGRSVIIEGPQTVAGSLSVPGDKSITHRALIFSAMGMGSARLTNMLTSADCLSTLGCLRRLGVRIEHEGTQAVVRGRGLFGLEEPGDVLDVGNSGTALRVLPALLAGQPFFSVVTGDASVRSRPVARIITPLAGMGAKIWARARGTLAPLAVFGGELEGIEYRLPVASAQVKTAVLLAGLLAKGRTTVTESAPSRDHTEIMLEYLGLPIEIESLADGGRRIRVEGKRPYAARDIDIPGDFSAAAFFLAAGLLAGRVEVLDCGLNPTRTGFLEVLASMGAGLDVKERRGSGEAIGEVAAARCQLTGMAAAGAIIPRLIDELPLIAMLATQARGRTVIRDAAELRVKETDRIALVASELNKMGAEVAPTDDGFVIDGPTRLKGAKVRSHGDHRLAMMLAVAALAAEGHTTIEGAEAVDVSFPDFFDKLQLLGVDLQLIE